MVGKLIIIVIIQYTRMEEQIVPNSVRETKQKAKKSCCGPGSVTQTAMTPFTPCIVFQVTMRR